MDSFHHGALNRLAQTRGPIVGFRKQRHHGVAILGDAARLEKIFQKCGDFTIRGQPHMADRMHDQRAIVADRQQMNETGAAENHACL
jgi:hypothetical protein